MSHVIRHFPLGRVAAAVVLAVLALAGCQREAAAPVGIADANAAQTEGTPGAGQAGAGNAGAAQPAAGAASSAAGLPPGATDAGPDAPHAPGAHDPAVPQNRVVSLVLPPDAPQRAFLRIAPAEALPAPLCAALNARVALDETRTARVSAAIAGRVTQIGADLGGSVKAGQALAVIDAPDLGSARADLAKARSDENRKRLDRERAERLFEAGVIAKRDLESAVADHEQARAESRRAELRAANLGAAGAGDGEQYTLRSPVAGVVTDRRINPGQEVRPDLPDALFTVSDLGRLWIVADLPERDIARAHVGGRAVVEADAWPGVRFDAKVERISPVLDPATRRIRIIASVGNADGRLRPEMFARLMLVGDGSSTAIRLPATAVVTEGLYAHVFVDDGSRLVRRRVEVALRDGDNVWITSGINAGEHVVTEGTLLVQSELAGDK
ncbi:efflux RND transporter periplasmic adaptor subunit [Derxia gummosa]|uniref:Efflux RND transporter periplasmic adaptor subunit n=1 Tax=Derxia gummosa DSM 723 TaxID=1121388 RepID=A0A8B6X8A9_9BURK|nr:efflux RND transporter periplasmic adaptor subunit [Derxia gummosa]